MCLFFRCKRDSKEKEIKKVKVYEKQIVIYEAHQITIMDFDIHSSKLSRITNCIYDRDRKHVVVPTKNHDVVGISLAYVGDWVISDKYGNLFICNADEFNAIYGVITRGQQLIGDERNRQIIKKGFTTDHDKQHLDNELLIAAILYAVYADGPYTKDRVPTMWPFENMSWKLSEDSIRNLVKAGALISAEIDRRLRQ
jgi:hypothetical protein